LTPDSSPASNDWILSVTSSNVANGGLPSVYRANGKSLKTQNGDTFNILPNKLCINCWNDEVSDFEFAELIVSNVNGNGSPTMADIITLETYFADKYGLTMDKEWTPKCNACDVGKYYDTSSLSCLSCPTGTSTPAVGSVGSSSCLPLCPSGSYSSTGGVQPVGGTCTPCEAGKVQEYPGQTSCHAAFCANKGLNIKFQNLPKLEHLFLAGDLNANNKQDSLYDSQSSAAINVVSGVSGACTKSFSTAGANGAKYAFPIIAGTPDCKLVFTDKQYNAGYTIAHLSRYSGFNRNRLLTADPAQNWLSGHFAGYAGEGYHEGT